MNPIIIGATPTQPIQRYTAQNINGIWRVLETVNGTSYIVADAVNEASAKFLAQAANDKFSQATRKQAQKQFTAVLINATRSLN